MKIAYLHQYFVFPEDFGGTRSYDLASAFSLKGYEVEIITSSAFIKSIELTEGWNKVTRGGLTIHILKLDYDNSLSFFQRILVFIKFLWYSTFKLLSIKADAVLATSTPLTIGIPALVKSWIHKTPFIFEVRDVWPEAVIAIGAIKNKLFHRVLYFMERTIYANSAAIVTLSIDMKASIISRYPEFRSKHIVVVENISEINRFNTITDETEPDVIQRIRKNAGRFTVLYAGTFGKVNGLSYLIDLATKVFEKDPSIFFILMGNGGEKEALIQAAKDTGILNRNLFIFDPIGKRDLPALYRNVSMGSSFVIDVKELWANSANKFFDSLAAGKPILINHYGWQSSTIKRQNIGYVLPPKLDDDAVDDFVAYTRKLELHTVQRANASRTARKFFSLDVAVSKYLNVIQHIIKDEN